MHNRDFIIQLGQYLPNVREYVFLVAALSHIVIAVSYPTPSRLICPLPHNLNPDYFTWSWQVVLLLAIIYIAGFLRIMAFRQLGSNFTFELAKPNHLIKTGLYKYMQHPSYLPDGLITISNFALFANLDGWFGCFIPTWVIERWLSVKLLGLAGAVVFYVVGMIIRVRDEEEMLRDTFGKEWEDYHSETARFIPGVF
jgi:protein-S-isoprenylcysteine O-methyltransferase Ste14